MCLRVCDSCLASLRIAHHKTKFNLLKQSEITAEEEEVKQDLCLYSTKHIRN